MNKCKCAILLLRSILFTPDIVFRRKSNVISVGASFKNPSILFAVYFIKCGDISHWNRWKVENKASTFGGRRDGVSGKPLIENKKRIIRSDEIDIFTKRSSFFQLKKGNCETMDRFSVTSNSSQQNYFHQVHMTFG